MKLVFKQRMFTWFDSYDIYDEDGNTYFSVEGKPAWGHLLHILDQRGEHIGTVKQMLFTMLPRFELYENEEYIGCLSKEWSLFTPKYNIDFNGWYVEGNMVQWDYEVVDQNGNWVATVNKELWKFMDTYSLEIGNEANALYVLMLVLSIDAEKDSRN